MSHLLLDKLELVLQLQWEDDGGPAHHHHHHKDDEKQSPETDKEGYIEEEEMGFYDDEGQNGI